MTSMRFLAIGALALACGCTPAAWEHESRGTPPSVAEEEECRRSAYMEAQHHAYFYSFVRPHVFRDRKGRLIHDPWPPIGYDPLYQEQELFRYCLQAKGYRLVPARPAETTDGERPSLRLHSGLRIYPRATRSA
jgi:hypothetical protein